MKFDVIVLGASAGGISAVQKILAQIRPPFQIPIVVAQHISPRARMQVGLSFGRYTHLRIFEAEDKMPLEKGTIYFAPPGYHLMIEKEMLFSLSVDEPVHYSRPSIDVLFQSAAWAFGNRVVGALLTGANSDGAEGLHTIHQAGGITLVQDPETSEVRFMPESALRLFQPNYVLPLEQIGDFLNQIGRGEKAIENQNPHR